MESATQVQTLDEVVCVSLHMNTLGKGINPSVPSHEQWVNSRADWFFSLGKATNLISNQLLLHLKKLPLRHILPIAEGLGKYLEGSFGKSGSQNIITKLITN